MPAEPDDRPPLARAMSWVARLTTIALEMVLPGFVGYGLDRWLGTSYVLTISGFVLGFIVAFIHLLRIAADDQPDRRKGPGDDASSHRS